MKPVITWILIADAKSARIIEFKGPGTGLRQITGKLCDAPEESRFADREGRTFSSFSNIRHKLETNVRDTRDLEQHVDEMLDKLSRFLLRGEFDRLIVCAPPQTLGVIRKRIPADLKRELLAELPKDLTHVQTEGLAPHFENILAV